MDDSKHLGHGRNRAFISLPRYPCMLLTAEGFRSLPIRPSSLTHPGGSRSSPLPRSTSSSPGSPSSLSRAHSSPTSLPAEPLSTISFPSPWPCVLTWFSPTCLWPFPLSPFTRSRASCSRPPSPLSTTSSTRQPYPLWQLPLLFQLASVSAWSRTTTLFPQPT